MKDIRQKKAKKTIQNGKKQKLMKYTRQKNQNHLKENGDIVDTYIELETNVV